MIEILIRYLGIKTKMLNNIKNELNMIAQKGDTILDLFAGSNVVGHFLMNDYRIYTNDIQLYSYVVSNAIVCNSTNRKYSINDIVNNISFISKYNELEERFKPLINYEERVFEQIKNGTCSYEELIKFKEYFENFPTFNNPYFIIEEFCDLNDFFSESFYQKSKDNNDFNLFSCIYGIPYFSTRQAIFIDSYMCWLQSEKIKMKYDEYATYLSALIYALNMSVTSIGDHFAQPQKFKISNSKDKYSKELLKIALKKTLKYESLIEAKLNEFNDIKNGINNKAFNMNANTLLNSSIINDVDVIYMDPPYTNAHYSRFYHILETLCKYDYPKVDFQAKYREDRYQSPFCIKTKAKFELEELIRICSIHKKKIIISYSDTEQCLISKNELMDMCNKYYEKCKLKEYDYLYRNFGQKPRRVKGNELLIICDV